MEPPPPALRKRTKCGERSSASGLLTFRKRVHKSFKYLHGINMQILKDTDTDVTIEEVVEAAIWL